MFGNTNPACSIYAGSVQYQHCAKVKGGRNAFTNLHKDHMLHESSEVYSSLDNTSPTKKLTVRQSLTYVPSLDFQRSKCKPAWAAAKDSSRNISTMTCSSHSIAMLFPSYLQAPYRLMISMTRPPSAFVLHD